MSVFDHVYYPFHHDHINTPRKHPPDNPLWTSDGWGGGVTWKLGGGVITPPGGVWINPWLHNVGLCWTTLATWWQRRRAGDEGNTAYASKIDEDVPLRQRDRRILCCQSGQELFVFLSLLDDIDRSQRVRRLPQMILQQKHRRQQRTYDVSYR